MRYAICMTLIIVVLFVALGRLDTEPDDGRILLEFWSYGTGGAKNPGAEFWEAMAEAFMERHPDVRVKIVADVSHGPYLSVLTTRFIGGNPPDVMVTDDVYVGQFAKEGLIMPLDGFIESDPAYRPENYPPSMVRDGCVDGERYSIPWYGGYGCLFYRTDLLAKAGVAVPQTWQELVAACKILQTTSGIEYPFAMNPKAAFWMMPWIWQNGGRIMSDDLRRVLIDSPGFIDAVQFVHDLMHVHAVMDPTLATGSKLTDLWSTGKAAIVIDGSWNAGRYDELYPQWAGKWDVAPVPSGKQAVSFFGGQHLIMSKTARRPDLAWEFMSFVTSTENQFLYGTMSGYPPGNLAVYDRPGFREKLPFFRIVPTVIDHGRNGPFAPFFKKIWYDLFQSNVLDVVMKDPNADIAADIHDVSQQMQQVADDYWATHDYYVQGDAGP